MKSRLVHSTVNIGLLVLVNALWGMQYTFYKLVGGEVRPITVSFVFILLVISILFPFFLVERWRGTRGGRPIASAERSFRRLDNLVGFLMIGVVGGTASSVFSAWGVARSSASNGALLTLTVPVITTLLAAVILHERMTLIRWASLVIALTGVLVLSIRVPEATAKEGLVINWQDLSLVNKDFIVGNLLLLAGCAGSSFYNVFSKGLLRRFSILEVLTYGYFLTVVTNAVIFVCFETMSLSALAACSTRTWTGLLLLGINGGMTTVLWLFLLTRLDVSQASVSIYLLPVFGVLLAAICLHEQITFLMIIGGAITLSGTILTISTDNTSPKPNTDTIARQ